MDKIAIVIGAAILATVLALITSIPLWLLWNVLMPEIFGLKAITWIQAVGLSFLSSILFKSASSGK